MKRVLRFLIQAAAILALASGCILFNVPPEISGIWWATENIDETYWTKDGGSSPGATAFRYFAVELDEPNGPDDIVLITVTDPDGYTWTLKDVDAGIDQYVENGEYWGGWRRYYSIANPHKVCLGTYSVYVKDSAGHEASGLVDFYYPGEDTDTGYDDIFSEDFGAGHPVGEDMLLRATGLVGSNNGTTVSVQFQVDDPRVNNGYIWFYDSAAEYITRTDWFTELEGVGWLDTSGGVNTLDVTAGDIELNGYSISDIEGFHVVLVDGAQYAPDLTVYDHLSISAYAAIP